MVLSYPPVTSHRPPATALSSPHAGGWNLPGQIQHFFAALCADREAIHAIEREGKLQALVGLVTKLSGAQDLHPDHAFAGRLHLAQRPGTLRLRGCSAPPASRMASNSRRRSSTGTLPPTWALISNLTPSPRICSSRRLMRCFSILKLGIP